MAADNKSLGRFILDGILPAPRGVPQVEVTFDLDANGILSVTAKDKATSKEQKITITGSTQLAKEEIDKMVRDAEAHADEDRRRREEVEARNNADSLAHQVDRQLRELGERVPMNEKARAEQMIGQVRELVKAESTDVAQLRQLTNELQQILHGLQSQSQGQQPEPGTPEDVVDADFKKAG